MAKIEQNGKDALLVFTEDELEWLGIEDEMNVNVEVKKGIMTLSFQKDISADSAKETFHEVIENIEKRPWISYIIESKAELINVQRRV